MAAHVDHDLAKLQVRVPESIKDLAILKNCVLYVSNDYAMDPRIIDFEMKMQRMGLIQRKQCIPMAQLQVEKAGQKQEVKREFEESSEIRKLFALLHQAVNMSASDVHMLVHPNHATIRMRVDGYLGDYAELATQECMYLIRALYVASGVKNKNTFSFDRPIAARLSKHGDFKLPDELYAVRFASMKADDGGIVVLRLLYDSLSSRGKKQGNIDLVDLGFSEDQEKAVKSMADAPNGMIVIVGPTGSGKSTTLKFVMQWIHENYPHFNILTVEDPPEYPIVGSTQIPVSVQEDDTENVGSRGKEYGSIIATTLRLDPDILMVGEIRDGYSAIAGLRAAETGHRLWTTLHANDAWESLNRLTDLLCEGGMREPLPVLSNTQNLCGLMAQRLVPKLCTHCRKPLSGHLDVFPGVVMAELMSAIPDFDISKIFLRGDGCDYCVPHAQGDPEKQKADQRHGILGRTVVAEIVRPDQTLLDIARRDGIPAARRYWLKARGGKLIADAAIEKIVAGILDPVVAREFIGPLITGSQVLSQMESGDVTI
ncbi:Flp pilus assembly complex ATPase component TadA [Acidithiobacillus sp. MC6.1]|nr:Flp pilus assembly complex ATPase component TadA [Acidithiobacillus sp. MC6.1]